MIEAEHQPTLPAEFPEPDGGLPGAALRAALEAILLVVDEPVTERALAQAVDQPSDRVADALAELAAEYTEAGRGIDLRRVAGGWRLYTRAEQAPYVERFVLDGQQARLTQAALETLAVVAYRQPVTRSRVAAVRGVNCDGVFRTLLTRGLVEEAGTEPESGGHLYRTTSVFLEKLGLDSLDELPPLAPFLPDDVAGFDPDAQEADLTPTAAPAGAPEAAAEPVPEAVAESVPEVAAEPGPEPAAEPGPEPWLDSRETVVEPEPRSESDAGITDKVGQPGEVEQSGVAGQPAEPGTDAATAPSGPQHAVDLDSGRSSEEPAAEGESAQPAGSGDGRPAAPPAVESTESDAPEPAQAAAAPETGTAEAEPGAAERRNGGSSVQVVDDGFR